MRDDLETTLIDAAALTDSGKSKLAGEIYSIYSELFRGWTENRLAEALFDEKDSGCKAAIFRKNGVIVGFAWIKSREVVYAGKKITVFNNVGGIRSEYRKNGLITGFFRRTLMTYRFAHPFRTVYCFQRLIHRSSYRAWANALDEFYPCCLWPTPQGIATLVCELNCAFGYLPVSEDDPFVVATDNHTKEEAASKKGGETGESNEEFFLKKTGGGKNLAMVMLFPCTHKNIILSFLKILVKMIRPLKKSRSFAVN